MHILSNCKTSTRFLPFALLISLVHFRYFPMSFSKEIVSTCPKKKRLIKPQYLVLKSPKEMRQFKRDLFEQISLIC